MSSDEVRAAVGEAPTASERLDVTKLELQQAEAALAAAEGRMDAAEVARLQGQVGVLRTFVERLTLDAAREAEVQAREDAGRLHAVLLRKYSDDLASLDGLVTAAWRASEAACRKVSDAAARWSALGQIRHELEILELRFELSATQLDDVPPMPNVAAEVAKVEARAIKPKPNPVPVLITANMTPEQVRRSTLLALRRFIASQGESLSSEVRAVLDAAPIAEEHTPQERDAAAIGTRASKEARQAAEAADMADLIAKTRKAYDAISTPTPRTPEQQKARDERRGKGPLSGLRDG